MPAHGFHGALCSTHMNKYYTYEQSPRDLLNLFIDWFLDEIHDGFEFDVDVKRYNI